MFITVMEAVIVSITLFSTHYILGYAYSNEKEVVDYVKEMVPLICLSVFMDNLQGVLSGYIYFFLLKDLIVMRYWIENISHFKVAVWVPEILFNSFILLGQIDWNM